MTTTIVSPINQVENVSDEVAAYKIAKEGYSTLKPSELAIETSEYGNLAGGLKTAGLAAASTASFSLSDFLFAHAFGEEHLRKFYEHNPSWEIGGEIAPFLTPLGEISSGIKAAAKLGGGEVSAATAKKLAANTVAGAVEGRATGALTAEQSQAQAINAQAVRTNAYKMIDEADHIEPEMKSYFKHFVDSTPLGFAAKGAEQFGSFFGEGVLNPIAREAMLGGYIGAQSQLHDMAIGDQVTAGDFISNTLLGSVFGGVIGGVSHIGGNLVKGLTSKTVPNAKEIGKLDAQGNPIVSPVGVPKSSVQEHWDQNFEDIQKGISDFSGQEWSAASENPIWKQEATNDATVSQAFEDLKIGSNYVNESKKGSPLAEKFISGLDLMRAADESANKESILLNYGKNFTEGTVANEEKLGHLRRFMNSELNKIEDSAAMQGQGIFLSKSLDQVKKSFSDLDNEGNLKFKTGFEDSQIAKDTDSVIKNYQKDIKSSNTAREIHDVMNEARGKLGALGSRKEKIAYDKDAKEIAKQASYMVSDAMSDPSVWGELGSKYGQINRLQKDVIDASKKFKKYFYESNDKKQVFSNKKAEGIFSQFGSGKTTPRDAVNSAVNYAEKLDVLQEYLNHINIPTDFDSKSLLKSMNDTKMYAEKISSLKKTGLLKNLKDSHAIDLSKPKGFLASALHAVGRVIKNAPIAIFGMHRYGLEGMEAGKHFINLFDFKARANAAKSFAELSEKNAADILQSKLKLGRNFQEEQGKLSSVIDSSYSLIKHPILGRALVKMNADSYEKNYEKTANLVRNHIEDNADYIVSQLKDHIKPELLQPSILAARNKLIFLTKSLPPDNKDFVPTPQEKHDFVDKFNATMYPTETLKKALNGTITQAELGTFTQWYPHLMQATKAKLEEEIIARKNIPYDVQARIAISPFFIQKGRMFSNMGLMKLQHSASTASQMAIQQGAMNQQNLIPKPMNNETLKGMNPRRLGLPDQYDRATLRK